MPTYRAAAIADSTLERAYGHAIHQAFYEIPNVELAALADPVAEPRAERAAEIGNPRQYDDYRDMLAAESPDLVAICPHHFKHHGRWLLDVIESGARGIYIEKPITASLDEADAVNEAADAAGTKIAVAHQNRYRPGTHRVAELVQSGAIGALRYMHAVGKCDQRGGTHDLRVLGTHVLDALRYIAGDVAWATGHMQVDGRDVTVDDVFDGPEGLGQMAGDALTGYFAFESGAIARFDTYTRPSRRPVPLVRLRALGHGRRHLGSRRGPHDPPLSRARKPAGRLNARLGTGRRIRPHLPGRPARQRCPVAGRPQSTCSG